MLRRELEKGTNPLTKQQTRLKVQIQEDMKTKEVDWKLVDEESHAWRDS